MMNYEDVINKLLRTKTDLDLIVGSIDHQQYLTAGIDAIYELQRRVETLVELRVHDAKELRELKVENSEYVEAIADLNYENSKKLWTRSE